MFMIFTDFWNTVWLVISVGFKFSWISCALLIHEKLLNFSYITKWLEEVRDEKTRENINPRNHLSSPNHEKLDPQKLPTIRYTIIFVNFEMLRMCTY